MEDIRWNRLVKAIKNKGTVLFIGPNVEKDENGEPVLSLFSKKMLDNYKGEISIDDDGFFFFIEPEAKSDVEYDMKEFYEKNDFGADLYRKIAAIPFHLIISLSPDDAIHNVFDMHQVAHQFAYYAPYKMELEEITSEKPLIYNLLGLATQKKYILTQENYFDYLKAVLGENVLPSKIIAELKDASNYIFLGFDFDKWYNRFLLMLLNFHNNKDDKTSHAIQKEMSPELMRKRIEKQFKITFIEKEEEIFIETLYQQVAEAGMLRQLKSQEDALKESLQQKMKLLEEYEFIFDHSSDPKERARCENEIKNLNSDIENQTQKLKNLTR